MAHLAKRSHSEEIQRCRKVQLRTAVQKGLRNIQHAEEEKIRNIQQRKNKQHVKFANRPKCCIDWKLCLIAKKICRQFKCKIGNTLMCTKETQTACIMYKFYTHKNVARILCLGENREHVRSTLNPALLTTSRWCSIYIREFQFFPSKSYWLLCFLVVTWCSTYESIPLSQCQPGFMFQ